ncbi:MAG: D-ala D-ala ligase C-terminus [Acidobacteria bacterium]|nr:D-ala D-ala ligase C-terminus [Acidobacteriota bacterium]
MTVIVLFGGRSDERHVSVASAQNVLRTLPRAMAWFWSPEGRIHDVAPAEVIAHQNPFDADFIPSRPAIWPDLEQALDTLPVDDPLFLLALHGGEGEDGTVQSLLEARNIPFTGSGSTASAAAFDKARAKELVRERIRVADERVAKDVATIRDDIRDMLAAHERIVLKPLAAGSSRGLFFLGRGDDVERVANEIAALRIPYIIEEHIAGRELTVGVIERDGKPFALPVIEIEMDAGFTFDYAGKYHGKGTREICPANIPDELRDEAQRIAVEAHVSLGCEGYSRTDLMAGDDGCRFLELNTLPGLTTSSLVPQQLRTAGIEFAAFLEEQLALARANRRPAPSSSSSR